jgi:hypothetical protein
MRVSPLSRAALAVTCHITVRAKPWPGKPLSVAWGAEPGPAHRRAAANGFARRELGVIGQPDHRLDLVLGPEGGDVGALQAHIGGAQGIVDLGEGQAAGAFDEFKLVGDAETAVEVGEGHQRRSTWLTSTHRAAPGRAGGHGGVGAQGGGNTACPIAVIHGLSRPGRPSASMAGAASGSPVPLLFTSLTATRMARHRGMGMSISMVSPFLHQADGAAFRRFRRDVADGEPEVPPEKRPSVIRAQALPRSLDFR